MNKDKENNIIKEYNDNPFVTIKELSLKFKTNETSLFKLLKKHNLPSPRFRQYYEIKEDIAFIYIKSKGDYIKAIIDTEDYERCKNIGIWSIGKNGYITNCKNKIYLHRFIMNPKEDEEVDHIFHNLLDNRKSQLRIANSSQQKMNTKLRTDNTSGVRGVYYDNERNTWNVNIRNKEKRAYKRFKTKEEAIQYCKLNIRKLHGDFAYNNIIENSTKLI